MPCILFSPIGGTDPIFNMRDGSMLHIARKFHPDQVVLYLSSEMLERERSDHRYTDCLKRLREQDGFSCEITCIERPELKEVQEFDPFLREFEEIVTGLHERFPKHDILLNTSSGTPGMKSALFLLGYFLPWPVRPVQVSTPEKRQNAKLDPRLPYDPELFWDCDLDNDPAEYEDRCRVLAYRNLNAQIAKENIEAHLNAYDYEAALQIAESVRGFLGDNACGLLRAARDRARLNRMKLDKATKAAFGIREDSGSVERGNLSEYLLWLQMKQKRGDLFDFLRGLTPALFTLMKLAVEENGAVRLSSYCTGRDDYITREALERDAAGQSYLRFFEQNGRYFERDFLTSKYYVNVINDRFSRRAWAGPLKELRDIEAALRNPVAHTIKNVDEAWLQRELSGMGIDLRGNGSAAILRLLRSAVHAINTDPDNASRRQLLVDWESYDKMNLLILDAMQ